MASGTKGGDSGLNHSDVLIQLGQEVSTAEDWAVVLQLAATDPGLPTAPALGPHS